MKKRALHSISWLWIALVGTFLVFPSVASAQSYPNPPQTFLDTTYTFPGGRILPVAGGGDFQAALNSAQPGDIIELQAGATFTGNFTLPNKSGTGWIYIRSSAYASLPPPGTRISPAQSSMMPRIITPNTSPAIGTAPGAHHYRFVGVEITTTNTTTSSTTYNLVWLEAPNGQTSLSQVPNNIIFDRCYIHGTPTGNVRRGIALNSARTAVIDSYLSNFHEVGVDSQALLGWNGPGPFKIVNNYLEGAGENILFGGGDPAIPNLVPSDIEIRRNYFFKPLSWRAGDPSYAGIQWSVKNIFELKNAQRVLVEGNIFENNWQADQNGFAILFTVRNQDGGAPWAVVQDVTFVNNIVRHVGSAVNILGWDYNHPSQQTKRILIKNNIFDDVNGSRWGGNGRLFQLIDNAADIIIDHNTAFHTENIFFGTERPNIGFVYRNNIASQNQYGLAGTGTTGNPILTLSTYTPGSVFLNNAIVGGTMTYPSGSFLPASMAAVDFVNMGSGNYRLAASSPFKNSGSDGKDIGADVDAIEAAINGSNSNPEVDSIQPAVSLVSASSISSSSATVTWATNEASDSQVEYGFSTTYGSSTSVNTSRVTSHSQTLNGMSANKLYHYRVKSRDAAGNLAVSNDFTFTTKAGNRSPYNGVPFAVPGQFEAENFDKGGEGVSYHDMSGGNAGGLYRLNEDVDIIPGGTGYAVNNIQTGEWLSYSINVTKSGTYRIEVSVSSESTNSRWHVEIDGVNTTGSVSVPNTGSWQTFQFVGKSGITLTAGTHILKLYAEQEYFNLNSLRIVSEGQPPKAVSLTPVNITTSIGVTRNFTATYSDPDGFQNLSGAYLGIIGGGHDQLMSYSPATKSFTFAGIGSCAPGQAATLSNSFLTLNCSTSSASGSGTTLTVKFSLTPRPSLAGIQYHLFIAAVDQTGTTDGIFPGKWTIQ